jgi:hypothetical protein
METKSLDTDLGLITEQAYAQFVGKTLGSVRNERHLGRGPAFVKLGRTIKYPLAEVQRYVAANTRKPGAAPTLSEGAKSNRNRG